MQVGEKSGSLRIIYAHDDGSEITHRFYEGAMRCPLAILDSGKLLQETINYAVKEGLPLKVTSRAYVSGKYQKITPFLTSYSTIKIPPATTMPIVLKTLFCYLCQQMMGQACSLTLLKVCFRTKGGQILYRGSSAAVLFKPENPTTNADDATRSIPQK